jgi:drug/metabolite transporter (DMT)-like permease
MGVHPGRSMASEQEVKNVRTSSPVRMGRTALWFGIGVVLLYNVLASANEVFVANRLQSLDPALLLFLSTLIALVFFNGLQLLSLGAYVRMLRADAPMVAAMNVSTAVLWVTFYVALKYAEPAIVTTFNVALAPVLTILLARWLRPQSSVLLTERVAAVGILGLLGGAFYVTIVGQSAVGSAFHGLGGLGLAASFVCGVALACNVMFTKRLYDRGWRASQIMGARFWALLAAAAVAVAMEAPEQRGSSALAAVGVAAVVAAALGSVLSLYLVQLGIERLEPVTLALLLASGPIFTLVLQLLDPRLRLSLASAAIVTMATVLVVWSVVARDRAERRASRA